MSNSTVQSVERSLNILECIAEHPAGLRLSDIAAALGLPISTVHRLLTTLQQRAFVQTDPVNGFWLIGQKCFSVGSAFRHHRNYVAPALPILRNLRDATRETANLGAIDQAEIISIAQVESREIMRAIAAPGGRVPLLNSGMGKAIMSLWPDDAIENHVARQGFQKMTRNSIKSLSELMADINLIRERGFAIDDEEYIMGMRCVAAPVSIDGNEPRLALSISGLNIRVTIEKAIEVGEIVHRMAEELSTKLSVLR